MANQPEGKPVVGHHAAWGLTGSSRFRVTPYKLTPGATDTMNVRVREKIDIRGVGTDVVDMQGTFTVRRDHPCPGPSGQAEWGQSCVKTEFRALELYGESPVFGTVRVHLDPDHSSHGEVAPGEEGSMAAKCVAHCFPTIELPELGMTLTTAGQPVKLASKVVQIPPIGDVARSENSAALVDEKNNLVGEIISSDIEVGDLLASVPLGSTGPASETAEGQHEEGIHDMPSGPGFYAQDPGPTGDVDMTKMDMGMPGMAMPGMPGMAGMPGMPGMPTPTTPTSMPAETPAAGVPAQLATTLDRIERDLQLLLKDLRRATKK